MPEDIALFDVGTHSNTAMKELLWEKSNETSYEQRMFWIIWVQENLL